MKILISLLLLLNVVFSYDTSLFFGYIGKPSGTMYATFICPESPVSNIQFNFNDTSGTISGVQLFCGTAGNYTTSPTYGSPFLKDEKYSQQTSLFYDIEFFSFRQVGFSAVSVNGHTWGNPLGLSTGLKGQYPLQGMTVFYDMSNIYAIRPYFFQRENPNDWPPIAYHLYGAVGGDNMQALYCSGDSSINALSWTSSEGKLKSLEIGCTDGLRTNLFPGLSTNWQMFNNLPRIFVISDGNQVADLYMPGQVKDFAGSAPNNFQTYVSRGQDPGSRLTAIFIYRTSDYISSIGFGYRKPFSPKYEFPSLTGEAQPTRNTKCPLGQYALYHPNHQFSRCSALVPGLTFKIRTNEPSTTDTFLNMANWGIDPFYAYSHGANYNDGWSFYIDNDGKIIQKNGGELSVCINYEYKEWTQWRNNFLGHSCADPVSFTVVLEDGSFQMLTNDPSLSANCFSNGPEQIIQFLPCTPQDQPFVFLLYETS